jgi:gliding motility-associated-like protein
LDGSAETFTGTGTGTFSFTTTNTVTATSDVLTLTNIVNNSTQDNCNRNPNESVTISVDTTTVPGVIGAAAISRDTIVCYGGSGYVTEYQSGVGSITKWQRRANGTATWVDINSTNTTQFFFNLIDTTEYRAVYQSGVCSSDFSNIITATPKALPVAVITTIVDDSICAGETADFEITVTNVDVGSTFEIDYKEGTVAKTSATLTQNASGVHTLTTSALTANTLLQLTSIEVLTTPSASIPACSNSLTSNGTVTVLDLPFASITAGPDTLCQQDKIVFTVTVTNVLATDNWTLRYELESDEDTITGTGPGSVTWVDSDSNTAESAKIQLIEILNLSNIGRCKSVNTDEWDIYIYKPTEPGTIAASVDTICKGGNTSISEVTGTPKQGVTVSWEYKPISASNWTALNNNNSTLNILNLQETTDYRAVYKSGVCDTAHSNVVRIQVEELPLATLSGNTTICAGDSASLVVTVSNVGANQDWELDYYSGTKNGLLTGTGSGTHTLRVGNFITNADVVLREIETVTGTPQCLNDKLTNNAQVRVNVNQRPYASLNSVVTPICQNSTSSFSFTVSNVRSGEDWTLTYQVDDAQTSPATTSGKGPGTFTLTTPALTSAKTYTVNMISIVNTTTSCDSTLSGSMNIVVDATTLAGSVASDTTVCSGTHVGTVNHTGGNGSIVRWETSQDGGTSWATIQNTNSSYTYTNLTKTSLFRVVKQNGVCDEAETSPITVTVNKLPVAVISGSDTICAGTDANLTVTVTNTQGEDWKVAYLIGTVTDTMSVSGPLTTGTINTGSIKTTTDITLKKVWMTSGTPQCENDDLNNNATATVEVDDEPNATLISLTDSVCTGSPAYGKVNVTDVRTSENWKVYWSINGGAADSITGTGAGSFNFTTANLTVNPSTVRLTRIVNMTTGCEGSPTDQDVVTVSPTTVGGTLSANDTVCKGTNGGTLTLGADAVGTILGWEYSTDNGSTWTTINNTASTHTYSNLTMTTQYRVKVKSGACNEEYSSVVTITVNELPVASIVSVGNNRICEGSSTYVAINVTNVGAGMDWELKYLQGSSMKTLTGTGPGADTIWTGTLTQTTDITFQSMEITSGSPQCSNSSFTNNYSTTITVIDNPTATITSYPTDICKGETPTVSVYVDDVLSSEAWTIVYKVNNGSNITSTGVGSGTFNLANMPAFNTEGPNGVSLISITNTSSNPNCTSMLTDSITINVDSTSVGGTLSGVAIVCKGDGGKLTLSGYRGDITKWQYSTDGINYYDIANTADTLVFSNLTTKTWYRVEVQNGVCSPAISAVHTVDIQELPTVTINNPTINICSGESTTLSLSIGNVPSTATWSITYTENGTSGSYTTGTGTSETITFGPYTTTTTIEITGITVTNGLGCANTISEKAVVNVTENPTATITTVPDSLCEGEIFTFSVTVDKVETGTDWELDYEIDGAAGPTKKGTGSGTFTVNTGRTVSPNSVMVVLTEIALDNALGCDTDLSDTAEVKVSPTTVGGTLSPSSTTICKGGSATLTLSGETGDVQNWEYSTDNGATWTVLSNKSTSVTITNIEETTLYRVFVKSGTCTGAYSTEAEVTVIPTPMATVTSNARVCPGDVATFTLTVTDVPSTDDWEVTYLRNGVLSTTTVTGTGSGDFNFTVAGSAYNGNPTFITVELVSIENTTHGCLNNDLTSSAQARVTPNPVASFIATNSCEDSTVMFDNTSTIAEGNISTYRWYFGDGDSSFNGSPSHTYSAAGTYNVTLVVWSDNGCRGEVTQTIEIYPNPVADFTFSNVCKNEVFSATDQSSVASGNITSWFWTFGDGSTSTAQNPTHSYAASGNYDVTLTVVTDNGCSNTVSKEVTVYILPEANFVAAPVCEDAPMQFVNASAIGYGTMTYEWDFAGQGTSTDKDPVFTFTGFGTFNVELIATSDNGCKDTIVRAVTVYPAPTADFTVADVCIGDESVFTNTSSVPGTDNIIEYFWDFGDLNFSGLENPTHTYAAAGDYDVTLRVKTDRGCENTVTKTASVIPLPDVDLTANGPTEFCDGDSVILSANANARTYDWTWDGGTSTDPTVTAKTEGWYKVTISAPPIGCENTDSIFITVWPLPDAKAWPRDKVNQSIDTISRGQSIDLHASGGVTYLWSPITYLNPSDMADVMAERVDDDITYTVTVTDENGCVNTADLSIVVLNNFDLTVYNAVTPNNDGRNDTWIIENIWAYPDAEVIIFNRYGMEVYRGTNYQNDWDATYNGNELPDGPYYYVVIHPDFPDIVYKGVINVIRETTSN